MAVILVGTLDTKGTEIGFVRDRLQELGINTITIDASVMGPPTLAADTSREKVFESAGTTLKEVQQRADRGEAVTLAALGATKVVLDLFKAKKVEGVLGLGGSAGTTIGTSAMRALPFGVPKLMVSTLASGQVRPFVGPRDILMMHSVTDISGINRISRTILSHAASAMAGMVKNPVPHSSEDKPIITATMFGVTTPCVEACRALLEKRGNEVLVFHAVGTGGEAMESLIADGLVAGSLDLTTTELADELVGGVLSAGADRLTAAARAGVPQVVSVGALDMVNFGPGETVPKAFDDRQFYIHNANVTLMRTTVVENQKLGDEIARKLSSSTGPYKVLLPLRGISAIDAEGKPFWNPEADQALFHAIRKGLPANRVTEIDCHINDPEFARQADEELSRLMQEKTR
ncbi:Tm-1-like ATP-binding domain-containing protein [bacterium]|nr:Tm-1-like ATP-binding domain-containing protein [bacterium]